MKRTLSYKILLILCAHAFFTCTSGFAGEIEEALDALQMKKKWVGDFDGIVERRISECRGDCRQKNWPGNGAICQQYLQVLYLLQAFSIQTCLKQMIVSYREKRAVCGDKNKVFHENQKRRKV